MEAAFAAYFGELVSEWNPLLEESGRMRFLWHEDVGAYDVCVQSVGGGEAGLAGGGSEGGAGEEIGAAAHLQAPERTSLREILDDLWSEPEGGCVDLTSLRRLVAALVQSSGRHTLHGTQAPVLGKHACARGKGSCVTCRYGFPQKQLARGGERGARLEKGDREGQWFVRLPRNDALCCSHEVHALLGNLGNIDWRPVAGRWRSTS